MIKLNLINAIKEYKQIVKGNVDTINQCRGAYKVAYNETYEENYDDFYNELTITFPNLRHLDIDKKVINMIPLYIDDEPGFHCPVLSLSAQSCSDAYKAFKEVYPEESKKFSQLFRVYFAGKSTMSPVDIEMKYVWCLSKGLKLTGE